MRRSLSSRIAAVLIAAVAIGCKHSDTGAPVTASHKESTSASRAGWVDVASSGLTISLPKDMQVKDLSQSQINAMMDNARQKRPNEQKVLNAVKSDAAKGLLKLIATLKHASRTGFHNAVAIIVKPNGAAITDDKLLASNEKSLEKISEPGSIIGTKITLPSGPAIRIQSNHLRPGAATMANTSYLIVHDNQVYAFSFASYVADKDDWRAIAQSAMESLKFDH